MGDSITLLNAIRGDLGGAYAERIPEATRENIVAVGNTILSGDYAPHTNAFFTQLLNRISATIIKTVDPVEDIYGVFGSKDIKYGDTIQKIFVDVLEAKPFVGSATQNPASMLAVEKGTIHVEYTSIDRKLFYKVTLSIEELKEAFLTVDKLDEFIRAQTEAMAKSFGLDVYIMLSNLFRQHASYVLQGYLSVSADATPVTPNVNALVLPKEMAEYDPTTGKVVWGTTGAKDFLKALRVMSRSLKFPHKLSYYDINDSDKAPAESQPEAVGVKDIKCMRTPVEKQVIALETSAMAEIDVDALAVLFNMSKAEVETGERKIELEDGVLSYPVSVDGTDENEDLYMIGFICDKGAVEKGKSFEASESFKNPEHLYINYWSHHWGYMAISKFADFVPIVVPVKQAEQSESEGE